MTNAIHLEPTVRRTGLHSRSNTRPQHAYIRMTIATRRKYNQVMGGFKHFLGPGATFADAFERYALPAMADALKRIADRKRR